MLGLLALLLVAVFVSLLGEALVPRGDFGGPAGAVLAGMAGAAQAVAIAALVVHLAAHGYHHLASKKPVAKPDTLTLRVKQTRTSR